LCYAFYMQTPSLKWFTQATPVQKNALFASGAGWMLDAMDVMLFSLMLPQLMSSFQMSAQTAGLLNTLMLISSAFGGICFGVFADRCGRVKALTWSILIYAFFTLACGFSQTILQLALFRILMGFGMGGEWGTGASLISETWPAKDRGKAMGLVQSCWAIGYAAAAILVSILLPAFGWRSVFFFGVVPALAVIWIRKNVSEPEAWKKAQKEKSLGDWKQLLKTPYRKPFLIITFMNAGTLFAWWGLFTWIPSYLALPPEKGGAGLDLVKSATWIVVMQVGMWLGYVSFGFLSDRFGAKRMYITFLFFAAILTLIYGSTQDPLVLLCLGPFIGFFGTGYFSAMGTLTAELFPSSILSTTQGSAYNIGRGLSAFAPFLMGYLAKDHGLGAAFQSVAIFFVFSIGLALFLPASSKPAPLSI
jgi:MFS family permease